MTRNRGVFAVALLCLALGPASEALAQGPLPLGRVQAGRATSEAPAEYRLDADSPGLLTVAVHGDGDLVLELFDADGQSVPDGRSDRDLNGNPGLELVTVTLGEAGAYKVRVSMSGWGGGSSSFQVGGSWLPFQAFARPVDPDGRPSRARALRIGEPIEDSINGAEGDLADWYVMTPGSAGTLVAATRAVEGDEGDLALEAFLDGRFDTPVARSDQDLQGSASAESVSVNVKAGQTVHIKVSGVFDSVVGRYRLSTSLMP